MSERNPNRRVQFPELGEGTYLLLRNGDCRTLFNDIGADWFTAIEKACHFYHADIIEKLLGVMVHDADGKKRKTSLADIPDDVPMQVVAERLMDAYCLAMHGRTYQEQLAFIVEKAKEAAEENPPTSPETSSTGSSA